LFRAYIERKRAQPTVVAAVRMPPPPPYVGDMTIQRMDHVGIVVDNLEAAIAFFVELGMELKGEMPVEGRWVDRVVGLDDVRVDIARCGPRTTTAGLS